ncbi:hypothetical protein AHAS_Ahas09G0276100 [Arachis hypogaea]
MFFNLEDQKTWLQPTYDPAVDGGHDAVHWSVRVDGLFKSYDNQKWVLTKTWRNDNCG